MIDKRIKELRTLMRDQDIDYYIIPSEDPHQSEYVAQRYKNREWISGFTGSAGTAVITEEIALLWTDGRYYIQAEKELEGSEFELMKMGSTGIPSPFEWIKKRINDGETIGFDGDTIAYSKYLDLKRDFVDRRVTIKYNEDLINKIWLDRPDFPMGKAFIHDVKYAGASRGEKIEIIREQMNEYSANAYIVTSLDDICWTLNIRGNDISYSPVIMSYLWITNSEVVFFADVNKFSIEDKEALLRDGIKLLDYNEVKEYLSTVTEKVVLYSERYASTALIKAMGNDKKLINKGDIVEHLKAIKNDVEIKNLIKCQEIDGVAMVRFIKWINENKSANIKEIDINHKLKEIRSKHELNKGESFYTIAAYGENAAMMHYHPTEKNSKLIEEKDLLLVDSGGQYLNGTTDITRTLAMGDTDDDKKKSYTLTLKSHIALARAIFIKGVTGPQLDILARKPMWDNGMDYKCGTGHGVGFFLNVHEGPHTIRNGINTVPLEKGMIITNEPGVYRQGEYGIRIENTLLVRSAFTTADGEFYRFETISFCPIDTTCIVKELLSEKDIEWLNNYHEDVFNRLKKYMSEEETVFLKEITKPI